MDVWRDELVMCFPRVLHGGLKFSTDFIVEDLVINVVAMVG